MELRDIEYFAVVAEHGHLGRAAESLGLSQSALSKSLRRLEGSVEAKLIKRTSKGVELTDEGLTLLSRVRPLRLALSDVAREVSDLGKGRVGHLRIGVSPGIDFDPLPLACATLLKEAPRVTLKVSVEAIDALLSALRHGELDLTVGSVPATPAEGIVQEHLFDDEFFVYAAPDHRLAKRRQVTIADLAQERWAMPMHAIMPSAVQWLRRVLEQHGLPAPRFTLETGSLFLRLQLIASSGLLTLTSRRLVRRLSPQFPMVVIPVKELTWTRHVGVSYRKDAYLSPVARRFIEILKSTARETGKDT